MSEENVELVRRGFEAFNARKVEDLVAICDPNCELVPFRAQLEGITYRGHEGVRRFMHDMDQDWAEFRIEPVEFHDRGDVVGMVGRVTGAGHGSGVEIDALAGFVFEVHNGLITKLVSHSDPATALGGED
jgi:ketosteroid isomerase-like protein